MSLNCYLTVSEKQVTTDAEEATPPAKKSTKGLRRSGRKNKSKVPDRYTDNTEPRKNPARRALSYMQTQTRKAHFDTENEIRVQPLPSSPEPGAVSEHLSEEVEATDSAKATAKKKLAKFMRYKAPTTM